MASHPDSKPACSCSMYSWKGSVLGNLKVVYRCKVGKQTRQYAFDASSISRADAEVCRRFNDENDDDYTVIPSTPSRPVFVGGGCLPIGTDILLSNGGTKRIEELTNDDALACMAFDGDEVIARNVHGMAYTEKAQTLQLELSNGTVAKCSVDQYIMTPYGPVKAEHISSDAVVLSINNELSLESNRAKTIRSKNTANVEDVVSIDLGGNYFFFGGPDLIAWSCGTIVPIGVVKD